MEAKPIDNKLKELFSPSNGYFGRVNTWGQRETKYANIGCVSDTDTLDFIKNLNEIEKRNLTRMLTYFEGHMKPLQRMLNTHSENDLDRWFTEVAWSHFATVIMFGLLEAAVKTIEMKTDLDSELYGKGEKIKSFLVKHIDQDRQTSIVERYKPKDEHSIKPKDFGEVIDDMWHEFRSGFIHDVGVHSVPLEPASLTFSGQMKEGSPVIALSREVPMFEWLIIT